MICPHCNRPLCRENLDGQAADRCRECGGLWLDEPAFGKVVRLITAPQLTGKESKQGLTGLACPKCNSTMASFNYAHDSGVFINKCHSCAGVWLADGQLVLIAQYRIGTPAIQSLANAVAVDIRTANRWRLVRDILRSRLLSSSIALIYLFIAMLAADGETVFRLIRFLTLPVTCIWFCDGMGRYTGIALGLGRPVITQKTPGDFVAIGGWLLLLSPAVAGLIAW